MIATKRKKPGEPTGKTLAAAARDLYAALDAIVTWEFSQGGDAVPELAPMLRTALDALHKAEGAE